LGYTVPVTVDTISKKHYWDITRKVTSTGVASPSTSVSGNQIITLYYGNNDVVTDPTYLTICKNTSTAATTWIDIGGTGATAGSGFVTSTSAPSAFNSYSRFTIANKVGGKNPLPIELLYFTATPNNKHVNLNWATSSEVNNDYYTIEKSRDGINFEFVTNIRANGNGNNTQNKIMKQLMKTLQRRFLLSIKASRQNKTYTYSNMVSVEFTSESFVTIFPNPAYDKITIKTSEDYTNGYFKIINSIGSEVKSKTQIKSFNDIINVSDLANGIYYIIIDNGRETENIKITIEK